MCPDLLVPVWVALALAVVSRLPPTVERSAAAAAAAVQRGPAGPAPKPA